MWTNPNNRRGLQAIARFSKPYHSLLLRGILWTVGVVIFRLAMPWPLRGVLEVVFPNSQGEFEGLVDYLPQWGDPVLWFGFFYLLFSTGTGITVMAQRINMMRFSAQTVHEMRAAAVKGAAQNISRERKAGDIIARVIGDSARIKAGISGILVHVWQNGLFFIGVCVVFLYLSPLLGLFFLLAGGLSFFIGFQFSKPVAESAQKHRRLEGDFAATLEAGLAHGDLAPELEEINAGSVRKDVKTTKLITRSTLLTHIVLAIIVGGALWVGAQDVASGNLEPGHIFLFIAYALSLHRRTVQIGRQIARSGKVVACANRISVLIEEKPAEKKEPCAPKTLAHEITFQNVKVPTGRKKGERARIKRTSFTISKGEHVAVVGAIGSGKSSLLRLFAGVESPSKGQIRWDHETILPNSNLLLSSVGYVPQEPVFQSQTLWKYFGLTNSTTLGTEQQKVLKQLGLWAMIRRMPRALESKIASINFSRNESRLFSLASLLLKNNSPLWVIDNPVEGMKRSKAKKCIETILTSAKGKTLITALPMPITLNQFDRVLVMQKGSIVFNGTPSSWIDKKNKKKGNI